ncbi:MAG: hypothetical protein R2793_09855 [Flavobacteriaceae bacterium]
MKRLLSFISFFMMVSFSFGQEEEKTLTGTVSFVTSNNVYVKFDATEAIEIGKTLQIDGNDCLRVTDKSSISIVCSIMNNCNVSKGDTVTFTFFEKKDPVLDENTSEDPVAEDPVEAVQKDLEKESIYTENIRGRASIASYNLFSNVRENRQRLLSSFSMDAYHIGDSRFSVQTFINYRNISAENPSNYTGRTSILNVYNLNVSYDVTPSLLVTAGRFINPKTSSLGANDGVSIEKYFGNFYVGALGGFRPDFFDYGFNGDLLQYGGYVGIETNSDAGSSQTTFGAMEQTRSGSTDRRFVYLQHFSNLGDLSLFGSTELDIFGTAGNETRLTNLYLSARYRFSRAVNLMVSYDSRKRIVYYETYQTELDQLLDEDLARQGIRLRLNVRPTKTLWLGASYSNRFQSDNQNKSDNIYGYATLSKIPKIGGRVNVSYNLNTSNYLTSNILSARYSREFFKNILSTEVYYRVANYAYENENLGTFKQDFYGLNLSVRLSKTWQLSILGEYATLDAENNYRFYTRLIKRFYSKKKK